jgi:uncharacterized protein (TIGR03032 family)
MGLGVSADGRTLHVASEYHIIRFDNVLAPGETRGEHDAIYSPHQTWITGDVDAHDIGISSDGLPIFANTLFNCLATVAAGYSFRPVWRPPFVSRLVPEDRCHLNGVAFERGRARYVTCLSVSDIVDGWRDNRATGGIVVDVDSDEIVARGLSMPHSPRLRDGKLWLLNSGTGEFGWIDVENGTFHPLAFCPGYARGLSFVDRFAVIALSRTRQNRTFSGLELEHALQRHGIEARCGLLVIDLEAGTIADWLRVEGAIDELFDVEILRGVRSPSVVGLKQGDVRKTISIAP